jgi:hypothetical protein
MMKATPWILEDTCFFFKIQLCSSGEGIVTRSVFHTMVLAISHNLSDRRIMIN